MKHHAIHGLCQVQGQKVIYVSAVFKWLSQGISIPYMNTIHAQAKRSARLKLETDRQIDRPTYLKHTPQITRSAVDMNAQTATSIILQLPN